VHTAFLLFSQVMLNCTVIPCFYSSDDNSTAIDDGQDTFGQGILYVLALVLGTFVLILLSIWVLSLFLDLHCCLPSQWFISEIEALEVESGPVAARAGLTGLTSDARRSILEQIWKGTPYKRRVSSSSIETKKSMSENDCNTDITMKQLEDIERGRGLPVSRRSIGIEINETIAADLNNDWDAPLNDEESGKACAICLDNYDEHDLVVTGSSCTHFFHRSCALAWLDKHDDCPCCRRDMMTPYQMEVAANQLSDERKMLAKVAASESATTGIQHGTFVEYHGASVTDQRES